MDRVPSSPYQQIPSRGPFVPALVGVTALFVVFLGWKSGSGHAQVADPGRCNNGAYWYDVKNEYKVKVGRVCINYTAHMYTRPKTDEVTGTATYAVWTEHQYSESCTYHGTVTFTPANIDVPFKVTGKKQSGRREADRIHAKAVKPPTDAELSLQKAVKCGISQ